MKDDKVATITLHILNKPYQVKCAKSQTKNLQQAAYYLEEKLREINDIGSLKNLDHMILMAALNITNEFLHNKEKPPAEDHKILHRVQNLQRQLTDTLTPNYNKNLL